MTVSDFVFKLGTGESCSFNIDSDPYAKINDIPDSVLCKNILTYDIMVSELFCNLVEIDVLTEDTNYEEIRGAVLESGFSLQQIINMLDSGCSFSDIVDSALSINTVQLAYKNARFNREQMLFIIEDIYTNELTKNLHNKLAGGK